MVEIFGQSIHGYVRIEQGNQVMDCKDISTIFQIWNIVKIDRQMQNIDPVHPKGHRPHLSGEESLNNPSRFKFTKLTGFLMKPVINKEVIAAIQHNHMGE